MELDKKTNSEILEYRVMVNILYDYYHNLTMANNDDKETKCEYYYNRSKMAKYAYLKDNIIKEIERRVDEEIMV